MSSLTPRATTRATTARYLEIENWLRARVLEGSEGDALPSEVELSEMFSVSRMTARQAVVNLASEGLVRRLRGSGTFIAPRPFHRHSGPLMSFTADMKRRGLVASSTLLTAELREASQAEREALRLDSGTRVVAIARLRFADGTPMAIEHTALTPDCAPVLADDLESGSLHDSLRRLGRSPYVAKTWISSRLATSSEAKQLHLPATSAVLVERRTISDADNRPVEFTTTVYHPERYVIDAVFSLVPDSPPA